MPEKQSSEKTPEENGLSGLYAVTGRREKPLTREEAANAFAPDPSELEDEEEEKPQQKSIHQQKSAPVAVEASANLSETQRPETITLDLPEKPVVRRTRRKSLRFPDIYVTRSLSVDKRLAPYFDDLMERGPTKTALANQIILKLLLEAGYKIDPAILLKPPKPKK